ncbi:unnamed protein product [Cercospora beticola]|nr:unnamed protein product [Cercospora beticola]
MTDPLSISVAALACVGAAATLTKTIHKLILLQNAPQEISELAKEIKTIQTHLEGFHEVVKERGNAHTTIAAALPIDKCINDAQQKTTQINTFLETNLLKETSLATKKLKKSAWLKWQSELRRLKQELRDIRVELGININLFNAISVRRNEVLIEKLAIDDRDMHAKHNKDLKALHEELSQQRPALAAELALQLSEFKGAFQVSLLETVVASMSRRESSSSDGLASDGDSVAASASQSSSNASTLVPFNDPSADLILAGRRHSETSFAQQPEGTLHAQELRARSWSTGNAHFPDDHLIHGSTSSTAPIWRSDNDSYATGHSSKQPTVGIQLMQRLSGCRPLCPCQCHHAFKLRTPDVLRNVTGQVLVDYSGMGYNVTCNEHACAKRQKAALRIQYHFPMWSYIQGVLTLVSRINGARGPEKILRLSRLRPGLHEVFIQVQSGDNGRLRQMFENGEASPYDATDTGWTLLHYALMAGQLHTAKFLTDAGADPHANSLRNETPYSIAWNRLLAGGLNRESELALRSIFNDTEQLDSRRFTMLHKIVLGLFGRGLREELEAATASINVRDGTGYTPLAWAAARGDKDSVQTLLEHGASVTMTNNVHHQPIHLAAQTGNVETVRTLIQHGADINARAQDTLMSPLHEGVGTKDDREHVQGLIYLGAEVEGLDFCGWTPLHWCCWRGYLQNLTALLDSGANVHARTNDGNAPLMLAVANNSVNCIPALVAAGAETKVVKNNGWSLLHYAAVGGKVETLRALAKADLSRCDLYNQRTVDTKQSVHDMFSNRLAALEHRPDELREIQDAWDILVERVNSSFATSRRASTSSLTSANDSEFVDACSDLADLSLHDED